ncbi:Fis family transcriptional regulator [Vandammella animalimorsus]|uniref:Putative Fis-like DNA-binding protein n=1 Tax=Vandammella animalimorsus TaxID=2029117 RepID=A0A2A2T5K8_9BURK|nr:helix-turn-helix domain-containing protein [Vandammella animalimorsus]RRD68392.1 Fis family transcriptional regulator [Comamonadaceae bacterium OH2310_COT-174]PAT30880.1 Fis family transcriptional regulator [Vandammella animalimorsus]PAT36200.1 Fis family transcriptional regulator [Vandammella animalimorsus]PAT40508.1 Fis family transcriptional regulator [Vandammella animalimorsus]PAT40601.1 Fis family transcriptional regulator [Vandammella animalimorsus]
MKSPLEASVQASLQQYFKDLDGQEPSNVYDMVIHLVERPVLREVMARAGHNQSRAALWLGLNRNTLRKKLKMHGMLDDGSAT